MPVTVKFNSRLDITDAPPVKRLVVYEGIEGGAFTHHLHVGFAAALQHRLQQCGVAVDVVATDVVGADVAGEVFASLREHHADVALVLRSLGGYVVNQGAKRSKLFFDLQLVELDHDRPRWRARSQLEFQIQGKWEEDVNSGVVFGTRIVEQLRDDRVVSGCPAKLAGWPAIVPRPGCEEERQRRLTEASAGSGPTERHQLAASTPKCE